MTSPARVLAPQPRASFGATLLTGLWVGGVVGALAGLVDGFFVAAGFDSEFFFLRLEAEGLGAALPPFGEALGGLVENVACLAAASTLYAAGGVVFGLALGVLVALLPGRRELHQQRHLIALLALGAWMGFELYWWTRPVIYPGLRSVDPRRLVALAVQLLIGVGLAALTLRLARRVRADVTQLAAVAGVAVMTLGGLYLATEARTPGSRGQVDAQNEDLPNLLVFVVDALRPDVLGAYGSTEVETPVIDSLADEGVLFENAFVQAPFTWTSFGSFLTGKYPRRHGLNKMAPGVRMAPNITLAEHLHGARRRDGQPLRPNAYVGAAFMTGTLSHGSGLLRGFDVYFEALVGHEVVDLDSRWSKFRSRLLAFLLKNKFQQRLDPELVTTTAVDWLRENEGRRFCVMVHLYSTHTPYDPIEPWRSAYVDPGYAGPITRFDSVHRIAIENGQYSPSAADVQQIRDLYHGGTAWADAMIGRVLDELRRQEVLDETLVVVTSDHGEELGEHDLWEHNFMYQTNLRVPLVMTLPGRLPAGKRIGGIVESVDLLPTVCDLFGLEQPVDRENGERGLIDGVSLVPLVEGRVEAVKDYSFSENGRYHSVQDLGRKLIVRRALLEDGAWEEMLADPSVERPRYFNLAVDPDEEHECFEASRSDASELYTVLKTWSDSMPIGEHLVLESARDLEAEALLEGLGYSGGVGEGFEDE